MKILRTGIVEKVGNQDSIQKGWKIKLTFDADDTGGYYLIFSNPNSNDQGFDNWFLTKDDALLNIDDWQMSVKWDV